MKRRLLSLRKFSRIWLFILILSIIMLSYYISANWYQLSLIHGDSMSPAYHNMQFVILDRHSGDYTYGDVIAFRCEGLNSVLMKRIAACPGDMVEIKDGTLYVNDTISVIYDKGNIFEYSGIAGHPLYLDANQYFVIGDNIDASKDSRYEEVGMVSAEDIIGKVYKNNKIVNPLLQKYK